MGMNILSVWGMLTLPNVVKPKLLIKSECRLLLRMWKLIERRWKFRGIIYVSTGFIRSDCKSLISLHCEVNIVFEWRGFLLSSLGKQKACKSILYSINSTSQIGVSKNKTSKQTKDQYIYVVFLYSYDVDNCFSIECLQLLIVEKK